MAFVLVRCEKCLDLHGEEYMDPPPEFVQKGQECKLGQLGFLQAETVTFCMV